MLAIHDEDLETHHSNLLHPCPLLLPHNDAAESWKTQVTIGLPQVCQFLFKIFLYQFSMVTIIVCRLLVTDGWDCRTEMPGGGRGIRQWR